MFFYKLKVKQILYEPKWVVRYENTNRLASIYADLLSRGVDVGGSDSCFAVGHRACRRHQWYFFQLAKTQACGDVAGAIHTGLGHLTAAISVGKTAT